MVGDLLVVGHVQVGLAEHRSEQVLERLQLAGHDFSASSARRTLLRARKRSAMAAPAASPIAKASASSGSRWYAAYVSCRFWMAFCRLLGELADGVVGRVALDLVPLLLGRLELRPDRLEVGQRLGARAGVGAVDRLVEAPRLRLGRAAGELDAGADAGLHLDRGLGDLDRHAQLGGDLARVLAARHGLDLHHLEPLLGVLPLVGDGVDELGELGLRDGRRAEVLAVDGELPLRERQLARRRRPP